MQFVSFFGMRLPAIPKAQTGLWLALVALLSFSMLCAQGVDVIDHKGTKNTITTVSADAGNLITTGSDEGAYLNYQNFRSKGIVLAGSTSSDYEIGLPADSPDSNIDDADILFITSSGGSPLVKLLDLDASYDGKTITIVELGASAPQVTINGDTYGGVSGTKRNLFIGDSGDFTSVSFIWIQSENDWHILQ